MSASKGRDELSTCIPLPELCLRVKRLTDAPSARAAAQVRVAVAGAAVVAREING